MSSLIPALSDKARLEIAHIQTDRYNPLGSFEAFQDLFDLDKYPITWEQLSNFFRDHHPNIDLGDAIKNNREPVIVHVARAVNARDIDIIGDIHGWWEKPQTY